MGKELLNLREMSTSEILERRIKFPNIQKGMVEKPVDKYIFSLYLKA